MKKENYKELLKQLGGYNKLKAMIGIHTLVSHGDGLSFKFKGSVISNYVKITLTNDDLYNIEYGKVRGANYKIINFVEGLYNDNLIESFEKITGLYLSL